MDMEKLLEFTYRWHALEVSNGVEIIDCDLLNRRSDYPTPYADRNEVRKHLDALLDEAARDRDVPPFVAAKLRACSYYVRALCGERIPYEEYVEATMGVTPVLIPEADIHAQLACVQAAFEACGGTYSAENVATDDEQAVYADRETIRKRFKAFEDGLVPKVLSWLGLSLDVDYEVAFVEKDAYWLNWLGTDEHARMKLQFNLHERKRSQWRLGVEETMVFHEICGHVLQALSWQAQARSGALPPWLALTAVYSPEQFSFEGIAQTLHCFMPEAPLSVQGRYLIERSYLNQLLMSNAHVMANRGSSAMEIYRYLLEYLPNVKTEAVEKSAAEYASHPLFRTYLYVYGISAWQHRTLAQRLNAEQKRQFVLDSYQHAFLPNEILSAGR